MISSIIWALVALVFILLVNYRWGQWQRPLSQQELEKIKARLDDLQNQISKLSMSRGFSDE